MMHCLLQKSQHLWLLFIEQYMNSNRVLQKRVKKKKKKEQKRKTQTGLKRRCVSKLAHSLLSSTLVSIHKSLWACIPNDNVRPWKGSGDRDRSGNDVLMRGSVAK